VELKPLPPFFFSDLDILGTINKPRLGEQKSLVELFGAMRYIRQDGAMPLESLNMIRKILNSVPIFTGRQCKAANTWFLLAVPRSPHPIFISFCGVAGADCPAGWATVIGKCCPIRCAWSVHGGWYI